MNTEMLLEREFVATAVEVEGRTVDVRIVPFGEVARVADPPDWDQYDEEWLPGCFDHQLNAANRVHANYQHERGISNVVGHGLSLRREDDGYHGVFTILETQNGDTALGLIKGGALPGVSLEAFARRSVKTAAGVIQRVKADLKGLAFCREGAFKGAQVLAVRTPPEQMLDAELLPHDLDPERVARLRAQGIVLPDRYTTAHLDDPDTSADADTSEADTRPSEPMSESKENGDARVTG